MHFESRRQLEPTEENQHDQTFAAHSTYPTEKRFVFTSEVDDLQLMIRIVQPSVDVADLFE